jgi:hypothetical protein
MTLIPVVLVSIASPGAVPYLQEIVTTDPSKPGVSPIDQPYGIEGSLTLDGFVYLENLAWPQPYEDIINTFGLPVQQIGAAHYYRIDGAGNQWAVIEYDGTNAVGYRIESF